MVAVLVYCFTFTNPIGTYFVKTVTPCFQAKLAVYVGKSGNLVQEWLIINEKEQRNFTGGPEHSHKMKIILDAPN